MTEGIGDCMPLALRSVGDAVRLDSENRAKEAYCQYLSCMIYISQVLKDDAWDKDLQQLYNNDTVKLFRLLQHCQERAFTIISSLGNGVSSFQTPDEGVQLSHVESNTSSLKQLDQSSLVPQSAVKPKLSEPSIPPKSTLTTPTDEYLWLPSPPVSPKPQHRRTSSYDPLEKAYQENKQLIAAYRRRIQNANKGRRNKDGISMNLGLMRRMSENLVIAKAREQAIKKKLQERQQRLQEETNRRFGPAVLSTKEQVEQRDLYRKILEFEQETVWPKHLRDRLTLMPSDAKLIREVINKIFSSSDHPLTQFLLQYQYHVYRKLAPLVKDVGIPRVGVKDKAVSDKDSGTVLNETGSDNEQPTEMINNSNVSEGARQDILEYRKVDEEKTAPTESVVNEIDGFVEGKTEEGGDNEDKNFQGVSSGVEQSSLSNGNDENLCSRTDLEKLKNLLDKTALDTSTVENIKQDEKSQNELKPDALDETDQSSNLEDYFQELEDEMFDWESNEEESCETENGNSVESESQVVVSEKSVEVQPGGNSSSGLESCARRNENLVEETVGEDLKACDELQHLAEEENEPLDLCVGRIENLIEETVGDHSKPCEELKRLAKEEKEAKYVEETSNEFVEASDTVSNKDKQFTCDLLNEARGHENDEEGMLKESSSTEGKLNVDKNEEDSPTGAILGDEPLEEKEKQSVVTDHDDHCLSNLPPREESRAGVFPSDELRKQLKEILLDARFFLEKLQKMLILAYEPLDTAEGRDLCYSCVEFPFFKPLWPSLLAVLRQVNYEKEVCLADVMSDNIDKGPGELGVPQRLCLDNQKLLESTGNKYPYQMAVEELYKVLTLVCPLEKLECIVRTSRCICQCVEDYWENNGKPRHSPETAIGCDDLLPILSFVIIQSGIAQLVSECEAMEEFIPEGYLMGEEGYCLTTLTTALAYLATLKPTQSSSETK
ncbi:VPS9 domain-containing protein 1-like isoform X1 [Acropora muricata]|uniref:VPS9 domain-containing protein 1-like isoform X1 n=1 Tax=Acropora muricata TaxID=159855 RepID=UPI0034E47C1F